MSAPDPRPDAAARGFVWPVRVYYEDTDAAGIVYHANYLRFMERARTEWLRALGFEQDVLARDCGIVFVITQSALEFRRAARFNAELHVLTTLERRRGASLELAQRIEDAHGRPVCTALNSVACVDVTTLKPRRLPPHMLRVFESAY